jgi:hypothetical protein
MVALIPYSGSPAGLINDPASFHGAEICGFFQQVLAGLADRVKLARRIAIIDVAESGKGLEGFLTLFYHFYPTHFSKLEFLHLAEPGKPVWEPPRRICVHSEDVLVPNVRSTLPITPPVVNLLHCLDEGKVHRLVPIFHFFVWSDVDLPDSLATLYKQEIGEANRQLIARICENYQVGKRDLCLRRASASSG